MMNGLFSYPRAGMRILVALISLGLVVCVISATAAAEESEEPSSIEERFDEEHFDEGVEHEGIEIDVRVGARRVLLPMAVPDTIDQGGDIDEAADEIESMLRRNLDLAGYFEVLATDSFFFDTDEEGMSAADIGFANWFNVGAHGLVKSAVREADGEYHLELRLFAVERGREIDLDWESSSPVSRGGIRGEINAFLNAVVKHYTGNEGPFGTRIAFSRRYSNDVKHVYTMEMDGSNRQRISRDENINLVPTFGTDGKLFYTNYRDGNPDLYVYDGDSLSRLSRTEGQNTGAAYCDGKLAVTMSGGSAHTDIYLIDPVTGRVQEQLTDRWTIDVSPTWSPDCSRIAFVSSRSGGAHIFVMNADGSEQQRLTFQGSYNTTPDWSPRGDRIVFSGRDEYHQFDLFTVDMEGNIERLTQDQGNNFDPSYSPDGRYVVFASDRDGGQRIWLSTHDGQVQRPLIDEGSGFEEPAWER